MGAATRMLRRIANRNARKAKNAEVANSDVELDADPRVRA